MKVKLKSEGQEHSLSDVEKIMYIGENFTQIDELKDTVLIIHGANHCEKFRLYKKVRIFEVVED